MGLLFTCTAEPCEIIRVHTRNHSSRPLRAMQCEISKHNLSPSFIAELSQFHRQESPYFFYCAMPIFQPGVHISDHLLAMLIYDVTPPKLPRKSTPLTKRRMPAGSTGGGMHFRANWRHRAVIYNNIRLHAQKKKISQTIIQGEKGKKVDATGRRQ